MRKAVVFISIITIVFMSAVSYADGPIKKLGRGVANVISCPLEIPKGISDANTQNGPIAAMTFGLLKGVFMTFVRGGIGVYEVVTFPIPLPTNYAPILTDPEFFLDEGLF
ncbi:MAG: exosortase system-associated protein, TIGR04073 family [Candidatus Omnitrophica bacterium]|nr:exosortase system-associated protein, TIGR04073 family [Candidatus Omnitrophota bacterium]